MRLIKIVGIVGILATLGWGGFDPSRFNFGTDWDYLSNKKDGSVAKAIDYVTVWVVIPSMNDHVRNMLSFCATEGKTPVFYGYLIAKVSGLGDQNNGGSLGINGGTWLRSNIGKMKSTYETYAQQVASTFGITKPIIWIMEPDYYQYCDGNGKDLSQSEAAGFMKDIIGSISKNLPNALFAFDVSPWCGNFNGYASTFDMTKFTFMCNTGGETYGASGKIRDKDIVTWSQAYGVASKCIIADCGYAAGGASTGHIAGWDDLNNLKNRINDGVVAITQKNPKDDWGNTINSLKSSLSGVKTKCSNLNFEVKYSLAISTSPNGKVTKSPDATTYDSGATVTVTATPNSGYKLSGWSGDATGKEATLTFVMTKDLSIKANFVDVNAKTQFPLTVNVTGSGIVKLEPDMAMFDSGSTVKLEAFGVNGGVFSGWGGALSGSANPASVTVTGSTIVTASFSGANVSIVNLVKNGGFTDGATGWTFSSLEAGKATGAVSEGEFAVTLQTTGTEAWHIQLMQTGVSLTKDKKYTLSFYGKAQSATEIIINIGMAVDPFTSYCKERKTALKTEKTKYEYTFTMSGASTSEARVEFNGGKATSSWNIDDVKLEEALEIGVKESRPFSGNNLLQNSFSGSDERVTIAWYDHSGRLIHTASGDKTLIKRSDMLHFTGSAVAVIKTGGKTAIRRIVNIDK